MVEQLGGVGVTQAMWRDPGHASGLTQGPDARPGLGIAQRAPGPAQHQIAGGVGKMGTKRVKALSTGALTKTTRSRIP